MRNFVLVAAVAAVTMLAAGCGQDLPSGMTAIFGQVVDPSGAGISGVHVGVTYSVRRAADAPRKEAPAAGNGLRLDPPYPNPTVDPDPENPVTFAVHVDTAGTARVEIWGLVGGVASRIRSLAAGELPAGETTYSWDGMDDYDQRVPNGLYRVRVTVPAQPADGREPAVLERAVLVSRTEAISITRAVFNAVSDPDGAYTLDNLPVGERLTQTNASGDVLGEAVVASRVTVFFQDPDYQGGPEHVAIGPGETVEVQTVLYPIYPSAPTADPVAAR